MLVSVLRMFPATLLCLALAGGHAAAQTPDEPAPPPPPPPPEAPMTPPAEAAPEVAPSLAPAPEPAAPPEGPAVGATDHDSIVGRWGVEARHLGTFQRSVGNDATCGTNCPISLNSFGVRRWVSPNYAWSAGLVFGVGGGSRSDGGTIKTWDTYLGIGPTVGANFLLTNWEHLAVSFTPQFDFLFFAPRGSGAKTFLVNARGLIEGELHMGFIGLPQLSLGVASGLVVSYQGNTQASKTANGTASQWDIGFLGPQSLWGLVTNAYLRFYF